MVSVYKDVVKDALYRWADRCTLCNRIVTARPPRTWSSDRIRTLRKSLYLAQAVFAQVLGVSKATVVAWENGTNTPGRSASRLLELIEAYPDVLLEAGIIEIDEGGGR